MVENPSGVSFEIGIWPLGPIPTLACEQLDGLQEPVVTAADRRGHEAAVDEPSQGECRNPDVHSLGDRLDGLGIELVGKHSQLEEELGQLSRPTDQLVEVFHFVGDEDSPPRVLCPWRVHPAASTLPAVARATAGRFVRCEWLVEAASCDPSSCKLILIL